jgi:calcineurin-like phosphoesterase family protein/nucleoside 2-deoxyribosyltransferase
MPKLTKKLINMARFFTSDTHFGDDRFNLFYRPFKTVQEQEDYIVEKWNSVVGPKDEVFHLGDFATTDEGLEVVHRLNGKIHLIIGNYDEPRPRKKLEELFESVQDSMHLSSLSNGKGISMNHYPAGANDCAFNLVGHIHGLWKVQRNMINVSTDAWHFTPASEDEIVFCMNAIDLHYDEHVFAGELEVNTYYIPGTEIYAEEDISKPGEKIFLAGPTPRSLDIESWRPKMIEALREEGFEGHILIPEKRKPEEGYDYDAQVEWEDKALKAADVILFWVPRKKDNMPGFTTNIEFGEWMKSGKVVLSFPIKAEGMRYMEYKAREFDIPVKKTNVMGPAADAAIELVNKILYK